MFALPSPRDGYGLPLTMSLFFVLVLAFPTQNHAQGSGGTDYTGTGGRNTIQGRIFFPSGRQADMRAKVKLESLGFGTLTVVADADGAFRFTSLAPGTYTIVVEAGDQYDPSRESVFIDGGSNLGRRISVPMPPRTVQVPIHLQLKRNHASGSKTKVLNAALADVPANAASLYKSGMEAAQSGNNKKAIELLRAAISLYPKFPLALNELGVQYLKAGQPEKAAAVLESAVNLVPEAFYPRLNYGVALLNQKKFTDAEVQLREAIKRNSQAPTVHLYLGIALLSRRNLDEAEKEFQLAAASGSPDVAVAHRYLGGIYWSRRNYRQAADELEKYLKLTPNASDAERTRTAITELRAKQPK